jgi:hypothetical protein
MTDAFETPHQRAEAALTAYGLGLPETDKALGWALTRTLRVRGRMFTIFGDKAEPLDALTVTVKLPLSYDMVQDLPFVRPSTGWWRQHHWAVARFGPDDDPVAELDTLKEWLLQGWRAMAPKRLASTLPNILGDGL